MPATQVTRGTLLAGAARTKRPWKALTANATLTPGDLGSIVTVTLATSATVTLPSAARAGKGAHVTVISTAQPSSGAGLLVDVPATDSMVGNGFTAAAGKGALNTQATAKAGDSLTLVSDGGTTWYIIAVTGTWAREA